jgi:hypothetical protein
VLRSVEVSDILHPQDSLWLLQAKEIEGLGRPVAFGGAGGGATIMPSTLS